MVWKERGNGNAARQLAVERIEGVETVLGRADVAVVDGGGRHGDETRRDKRGWFPYVG